MSSSSAPSSPKPHSRPSAFTSSPSSPHSPSTSPPTTAETLAVPPALAPFSLSSLTFPSHHSTLPMLPAPERRRSPALARSSSGSSTPSASSFAVSRPLPPPLPHTTAVGATASDVAQSTTTPPVLSTTTAMPTPMLLPPPPPPPPLPSFNPRPAFGNANSGGVEEDKNSLVPYLGAFDGFQRSAQRQTRWMVVALVESGTGMGTGYVSNTRPIALPEGTLLDKKEAAEGVLVWRRTSISSDLDKYRAFYPVDQFPHIALLDPRTGERLQVWHCAPDSVQWMDDVHHFLKSHSLKDDSTGPWHHKEKERAVRTRRVDELANMVDPHYRNDLQPTSMLDNEEAAIAAAIAASLQDSAPSTDYEVEDADEQEHEGEEDEDEEGNTMQEGKRNGMEKDEVGCKEDVSMTSHC